MAPRASGGEEGCHRWKAGGEGFVLRVLGQRTNAGEDRMACGWVAECILLQSFT